MKLGPLLFAALALAACPGGGGGGTSGGGQCHGLSESCTSNANCCSGFFCDRSRCVFGTAPATSGGAGAASGGVQGTSCDPPNVLCDGACIPASECGVNAGGNGGTTGGGSTSGGQGGSSTGAAASSSAGGGGGCPVDAGAAGAGCTVFAPPILFAASVGVQALAIGDVDGDRIPDLVAAGGGGLVVYFGTGCGGFRSPATLGSGADWEALALGHLRPDGGLPDIAAVQGGSSSLGIFLDRGFGLFADAGSAPLAGDDPVSLAIGDVDRDGKPDLVVSDQGDGTVALLRGNGDGTFQPPETFPACPAPGDAGCAASGLAQLALADLNGDGWPDVAAASAGSDAVAVLLGGDGGFRPAVDYATQGVGPTWIATADVHGDGRPDLVVSTMGSGTAAPTVELFRGADGGSFGVPASFVTAGPNGQVAAASLRPGVLPDVVVADPTDGAALLFLNDGNGNLASRQSCPATPGATALAVGDLNGDGKPDAVLAAGAGDAGVIAVLLNVSF